MLGAVLLYRHSLPYIDSTNFTTSRLSVLFASVKVLLSVQEAVSSGLLPNRLGEFKETWYDIFPHLPSLQA